VHQVEMHPYNVQEDQLQLCKAFDIKMMAFCSFGPAR
jgi:diketogulonate reductase-like aldo/keto reductase